MIRDSVEFLEFTLEDRNGEDISGDVVQVALAERGKPPTAWLACTYVGPTTDANGKPATHWRTTAQITWSAVNYPASSYLAYAKVADAPETPLAQIGLVNIR